MRPTRLGLFALLATVGLVSVACGSGGPAPTTSGGAASSAPAAGKPTVGGAVTFVLENDVIDSMKLIQLIELVEERLHVHIDDTELVPDNFTTIDQLTALVQSKMPA